MVRLKVNDSLASKLQALVNVKDKNGVASQLPLELLDALQKHLDCHREWIDHALLAKVGNWNKSTHAPNPSLSLRELIKGSEVYLEPPVVKARSRQLEAILAPIRLAQEQASYTAMLSTATPSQRPRDPYDTSAAAWNLNTISSSGPSFKQEWDSVRRELSAVLNVLASMAAVSTAVWWAAGTTPLVEKTLLSLFGGLAIAAIEGFLYVRYFQRMSEASKKGKHHPLSTSLHNGTGGATRRKYTSRRQPLLAVESDLGDT